MWSVIQLECLRSIRAIQVKIAILVVVGLTFVGFRQYVSLDLSVLGGGSAWLAFGQSAIPVGVLLPAISAIAFGDRMASDAKTGYLALQLLRVSRRRVFTARLLVASVGSVILVIGGLIPAFLAASIWFPFRKASFSGALSQYHMGDWLLTLINIGILALAVAAWTVLVAFVVSAVIRSPYAVMGVSIAGYLVAGIILVPRFNPIVHMDLLNYVPAAGPLWTDVLIWAGLLLGSIVLGTFLWTRRRDLFG